MNLNKISKFVLLSIFTIILYGFEVNIHAQQTSLNDKNTENQKNQDVLDGDVVIVANVTAKELKFEVVPNPSVEFPATKNRKNVWEAERVNLPQSVEPGITYRNIGIRLRIVSRFADIERIVAEALGEIPANDVSPQTNQIAPPPTQSAPPSQKAPPKK